MVAHLITISYKLFPHFYFWFPDNFKSSFVSSGKAKAALLVTQLIYLKTGTRLVNQKVHIFFLPRLTLVSLTTVEIVSDLDVEKQ